MTFSRTDIPSMATLSISLSEQDRALIEARVKAGIYKDVDSYIGDLIRADLAADDWEVTPELAAALEEGEASGFIPYDREAILREARAKFRSD